MKKSLLLVLLALITSLPVLSAADASEYYPMLVEGRTWKYSEHRLGSELPGLITFEGGWSFGVSEYKVHGDTVIDGNTYKKIYVYYDKSTEPYMSKPIYLARENAAERAVYLYFEGAEINDRKVYDFIDMKSVDEYQWACFIENTFEQMAAHTSLTLKNGIQVSGFDYQSLEVYEGVGWFDRGEKHRAKFGDLFGASVLHCMTGMASSHDEPRLYAVCEADGTEIFAIEEHRPEVMGLEAVRAEGADSEAAAVYYRFDGVRFDRRPTEPGIYIRVAGAEVSKVVI